MIDFEFEIAGPMAMFMRPDSGSSPVSYPLPTGSAIKAMVESIAWVEGAVFRPNKIEVCSPIRYGSYACNYGGPLRKGGQIKSNTNYQHYARVLVDPCFKVYGTCEETDQQAEGQPCKKLQEMLLRRLANGQSRFPASLGWKEFSPSYFGSIRSHTSANEDANAVVEGYLLDLWTRPHFGLWKPKFVNVEIIAGTCRLPGANHAT